MFTALQLAVLAAVPPWPATLVGYSAVTSEDGKHSARLLTVAFPLTAADHKLLSQVMNSDPYWHHFRQRPVFLRVGDRLVRGGPRLLGVPGQAAPVPGVFGFGRRGRWLAVFVLPADVPVAGVPLRFYFADRESRAPEPEPTTEPFATLRPTAADLKRVTAPLRAERVLTAALPPRQAERTGAGHAVVFRFNFAADTDEFRVGDEKAVAYLEQIESPEGAARRYLWQQAVRPGEVGLGFKGKPPADGAVSVKPHGLPGWYKCETADTPKGK
ncbi:MAG: hypothetical protein K2X82_32365 [Gemmataceae bacterium]|nr:hypothetical protein [Gemmataceae bacterium]